MTNQFLPTPYQQFIHLSRYSRWLPEQNRRETWEETVNRYFNFFDEHLKENNKFKLPKEIREELRQAVLNLEILPSMRALMTAGEALKRDNIAGYNPVCGDTLVVTRDRGNVPIRELNRSNAVVLNKDGRWTDATIRSYGVQSTSKVTLRLNSNTIREVTCTDNHRWILSDGTVKPTSELVEGDSIPFQSAPKPAIDADYRLGVIHGLVYGDGTAVKSHERVKGYHIRLCGQSRELLSYFDGYPVSYPPTFNGDPIVMLYDGFAATHELKSLPSQDETESYLLGFIRGWIAADGSVSKASQVSVCVAEEGLAWLNTNSERLGFVIQSVYRQKEETNYGVRRKESHRVSFSRSSIVKDDLLCSWKRDNFKELDSHFVVGAVTPTGKKEEVFCAEVPDTNTFVLSMGLVTGNCSYAHINRVRAFDEILYVLMCGTGVGFSVERQFVDKLPTIAEEFSDTDTTIIVSDSKQGWAKAYRELVSLLIVGQIPKWDLSKVRPAGARLKVFGGRASGPRPLEELFKFTADTFRKAAGRKLTSIECHDIVCKIAEIVVVGGVRRSALISLSNLTDERMRDAKSGAWWEANPQRALSNNSVAYKEKPDIGIFMEEWLSLYKSKSGERGIFNRDAAQKGAARLGDRRDASHEFGTNPCCLDGNTLVQTNQGQMPISQVIMDPDGFLVLSYNHETEQLEYTEIISGDMTRPNADVLEVTVEDENGNESVLRITPDHQVWTETRGYVDAEDLQETDVICISSNYKYGAGVYTEGDRHAVCTNNTSHSNLEGNPSDQEGNCQSGEN